MIDVSTSSEIVQALVRGDITGREAAALLAEIRSVRRVARPESSDRETMIALVKERLIRNGRQNAHALVFGRRAQAAQGMNALMQIVGEYTE